MAIFEAEWELVERGYDCIIGTDEVGRGPLAGPVVAAAVMLKEIPKSGIVKIDDKNWELIKDSKKLSERQREKVFDFISQQFHVGIGLCSHETIDRINILEASFLAMKKAVQELKRNTPVEWLSVIILVDGNKTIPNFSHDQRAIIGGDGLVKSISAASIVAKVTRDRMMKQLSLKYPGYGFEKHMGYGTKLHMDALREKGPCAIHRKSFAPVKRMIKNALN